MVSKKLLLFSTILLISACGPIYETKYSFVSPQTDKGKQCIGQCLQTKNKCDTECAKKRLSCRQEEYLKASGAYNLYIMQKAQRNEIILMTQDDFADYGRCDALCNVCNENYRLCYTGCGGKIIEKKECVAFCDQK